MAGLPAAAMQALQPVLEVLGAYWQALQHSMRSGVQLLASLLQGKDVALSGMYKDGFRALTRNEEHVRGAVLA